MLHDKLNRPLHDLRISVTDRCNFRCGYCMPASKTYQFLPRQQLLSFEEITDVVAILQPLGLRKIRLTGGEPLLRKDLETLVEQLATQHASCDLALTTNGYRLGAMAQRLKDAGLKRATVSLDSLIPTVFAQMSGRSAKLETVLEAMEAAQKVGLSLKVNMVVQRGINDGEILAMARYFRERSITLRFIEFMDVGNLNDWERKGVVSQKDILEIMASEFEFSPLPPMYPGEVAGRFAYEDGKGEFGIIASVTAPFCGGCSRLRLSASGVLYTCLFAKKGHDLKTLIRMGKSREAIKEFIANIWGNRSDQYSQERSRMPNVHQEKVEMYHIGG